MSGSEPGVGGGVGGLEGNPPTKAGVEGQILLAQAHLPVVKGPRRNWVLPPRAGGLRSCSQGGRGRGQGLKFPEAQEKSQTPQ